MLLQLKNHKLGQVRIKYMALNIWSEYLMHPLVQMTIFMTFLITRTKLLLKI